MAKRISDLTRSGSLSASNLFEIAVPNVESYAVSASQIKEYIESTSPVISFKNKIINGNFDFWKRGTSQTSNGYGSDDRWRNSNSGSTKTTSRQTFTLGQTDVPNNPKYFSRTVVTTGSGASDYVIKRQKIEGVNTFAGETVTLSFYAKADSSKNIAVEFGQYFGSGGTPSATVDGIGVTTLNLTSSWQKFTVTVDIPSISGKTLGTDSNDLLQLNFWFDAGSDWNTRTNSLGNQSGTFDIAQVQLEKGSVATPFENRPIGIEETLCERYYTEGYYYNVMGVSNSNITNSYYSWFNFPVTMREIPSITGTNSQGTFATGYTRKDGCSLGRSNTVAIRVNSGTFTADAEL
jgi:hypothetical protein